MKKFFYTIFAVFLMTASGFAQDEEFENDYDGKRFLASIIAGMNISQVDGDRVAGYYKFGAQAGVGVSIVFHKNIQAQIDILYNQLGAKTIPRSEIADSAGSFFSYKVVLDYASVPIVVKYVDQKVQFEAGVSLNNLVRFKEFISGVEETDNYDNNPYKRIDVAMVLGGTFFITDHIGVNIRWQRSFVNAYKGDASTLNQTRINKYVSLRGIYQF